MFSGWAHCSTHLSTSPPSLLLFLLLTHETRNTDAMVTQLSDGKTGIRIQVSQRQSSSQLGQGSITLVTFTPPGDLPKPPKPRPDPENLWTPQPHGSLGSTDSQLGLGSHTLQILYALPLPLTPPCGAGTTSQPRSPTLPRTTCQQNLNLPSLCPQHAIQSASAMPFFSSFIYF